MARYKDEQCRICRREGQKLFLKGARCYSDKCSISRRNYAPGQHGQKRAKLSEYGTQLREKQKTKAYYGVGEKQFRKYFEMASNKKGVSELFLTHLFIYTNSANLTSLPRSLHPEHCHHACYYPDQHSDLHSYQDQPVHHPEI